MMQGNASFKKELTDNILPFWSDKMIDAENGGFYGRIDGYHQLDKYANKGAVMHARILWTFSAAYRVLHDPKYLQVAERAFNYIKDYFLDPIYGGVFWELNYKGEPKNRKKQTYAQGFALYAFTEFYRATKREEAFALSRDFFELIENCKDPEEGGYWEAFTEDWKAIGDTRLSDKDENVAKTMNTHLHILEPYTNLLRIDRTEQLVQAQRDLIQVFTEKIWHKESGHLQLFFDKSWHTTFDTISYGHDIEAAWLLWEAVTVLGDQALMDQVRATVIHIGAAAQEGLLADSSLAYELKGGHLDAERHWWVQAEAIVGFQYLGRFEGYEELQKVAKAIWHYIQDNIIDKEQGEWYWSRLADGTINREEDKAGFWKCPYHNGRMCLEIIEHFEY